MARSQCSGVNNEQIKAWVGCQCTECGDQLHKEAVSCIQRACLKILGGLPWALRHLAWSSQRRVLRDPCTQLWQRCVCQCFIQNLGLFILSVMFLFSPSSRPLLHLFTNFEMYLSNTHINMPDTHGLWPTVLQTLPQQLLEEPHHSQTITCSVHTSSSLSMHCPRPQTPDNPCFFTLPSPPHFCTRLSMLSACLYFLRHTDSNNFVCFLIQDVSTLCREVD